MATRHEDFEKIYRRFTAQYESKEAEIRYKKFLEMKGLDESAPLPRKEKKELLCAVRGVEFKEIGSLFYVRGFAATSHIDRSDANQGLIEGYDVPDIVPKDTLVAMAAQMRERKEARICGVHHSEGKTGEYYGEADTASMPPVVVELADGEWGLEVNTIYNTTDPLAAKVVEQWRSGELDSYSITYSTNDFQTTDFEWVDDKLVRVVGPQTRLYGYTAASNPVNPNAKATSFGYKEFKELIKEGNMATETNAETIMPAPTETKEQSPGLASVQAPSAPIADAERKEFEAWKAAKERKELYAEVTEQVLKSVQDKLEVKEKVLRASAADEDFDKLPLEMKELREVFVGEKKFELKEQLLRASNAALKLDLWDKTTTPVHKREFKNFMTNGTKLEYKGLGITTNATTYTQSAAELSDMYDPVIYNGLNEATVTWNVLRKDNFAGKGNDQVQFTLKTAANGTAAAYVGNAVTTANTTRTKFQTKFKKYQAGISVDGDMIAAARGGPVGDVYAQEIADATSALLAVINAALYANVGLETAAGVIGFQYIADSAGNTTLYGQTRTAANKLAPDAAGDTYINGSSLTISNANLRAAIKQCLVDGSNKANLCFFTSHTQGNIFRTKMEEQRRLGSAQDTRFGFETDLFFDGVPVFEDKDCGSDDWFLVDLDAHRVAIWVPPTIEKLGKTGDSEEAFIKTYFATYNRAPRRLVMVYGNATS